MRMVIFTPALKASAIGRSTSLITQALAKKGHAVVVVRSEDASLMQAETHDFGVELMPWTVSGRIADVVRDADVLVYQIGDNYAYHCGALEWLSRAPGVICLHDFFLGNLFLGWAQNHMAEAMKTLGAWYGDKVASAYFGHGSSEQFIEATKVMAPMIEWICSMAYGVITHSGWGVQRVLDSCAGPVHVVPLAYDAPASESLLNNSVKRRNPTEEFKVLTVGHVNPNKRAESVIRAVGSSAVLRGNTTYRLVGLIQPKAVERLAFLATSLQVKLVISGEVDSDTLLQEIEQAHAICCLRWPSLEAASASAIEAMLYGKPVIVTDTGFYSELPSDCLRKIQVQNEIPELQRELEQLFLNEDERLRLGAKAAEWAAVTFSAENYANHLIDVSIAAHRAVPMLKASHSFAGTLWRWEASRDLIALRDTTEPLSVFDLSQETSQRNDSNPTKLTS